MLSEDSAVRKLSTIFPDEGQERDSSAAEEICGIQVTREELNEIINLYRLNPDLVTAYNFIVETRKSGAEVLRDMALFTFPDGEGKKELSELEKRMLKFNNDSNTERYIISIMGKKANNESKFI